ncbi:MmcQ/YjbR family DNA-binding protein [Fibrivirga algicola]|uniref:MmcQ/YjbR family DNA-binding protein n=1 Tax=Fibrivirga algicola TaxID=2950420 RepID=A0ABX0QB15_9BACT|nr:MmcQ/YjbR family DNA-binding protein [Fibrivirga algicola]ARK12946.1 MmcQ-like protein [Fibrella sp. ES10-3-2-2]NID09491.1 MmcQ/YjbR family DNA-binding protein [Fibrivirga algicola]
MTFDELRDYCLSKPATTESLPFDEFTLVFKVAGKMFALSDIEARPMRVSLKCDPERAVELREVHEAIQPAFHMNKTHWNTVTSDGSLRDSLIRELIDHSYERVVAGLPKASREALSGAA